MTTNHSSPKAAGKPVDASQIPVLTSARLRLRAFRLDDLPAAVAMWSDPEVVKFIGGTARTEAQVWTASMRSFGYWAVLGYGFWVMADKQTDRYLGELGFLEGLREVSPGYVGTPEAGWAISQDNWGMGYASEGLALILQWADQNLHSERTVCLIDLPNLASQRVAQKNGYRQLTEAIYDGGPVNIFQRAANSS